MASDPIDDAVALLDGADELRGAGRLAESLAAGEQALAILEAECGSDHPDVANALLAVGRSHEESDAYGDAEVAYRRAMDVMEQWADDGDDSVQRIRVQARIAVGQIERILGRLDDAHATLSTAIQLAEERLGADDADTGTACNALGIVCKYAGRWGEGAAAYERALHIVEATEGPSSSAAATIWHNIGGLAFDAGDYAAAEAPARRAAEIREAVVGPDDPAVAADIAALASIVDALGRDAEAAELNERALAVFERTEGADYDLAVLHNNLGVAAAEHGDLRAARGHYRDALAIKERLFGADHADVAMTLYNLAAITADSRRARALLTRALRIFEASLASDHPKVVACRAALRDLS